MKEDCTPCVPNSLYEMLCSLPQLMTGHCKNLACQPAGAQQWHAIYHLLLIINSMTNCSFVKMCLLKLEPNWSAAPGDWHEASNCVLGLQGQSAVIRPWLINRVRGRSIVNFLQWLPIGLARLFSSHFNDHSLQVNQLQVVSCHHSRRQIENASPWQRSFVDPESVRFDKQNQAE